MTRWRPYFIAALGIPTIWLLLNQSISPGNLILAALFFVLGARLYRRLEIPTITLKQPLAIIRLLGAFAIDALRSNMKVTKVILLRDPARRPGFVYIPLDMRSPYGLAALACIITATPGTSWVSHNPADGYLAIHVLDLSDDDDWAEIIKTRYETLLMEIFE